MENFQQSTTVRPATALLLVPGIYSAIENSVNRGSCYLVPCKFLQMIALFSNINWNAYFRGHPCIVNFWSFDDGIWYR